MDDPWSTQEGARALLRARTGTAAAAEGHLAEQARRRATLLALLGEVAALFTSYGFHAGKKLHTGEEDLWAFAPPHQPALFLRVSAAGQLSAHRELVAGHAEVSLDAELLYDRALDRWFGAEVTGRALDGPGFPPEFESPVETLTRAILHAGGWP